MKKFIPIILFPGIICIMSCNNPRVASEETSSNGSGDTSLAAFINNIKAVDNHAHVNTIESNDKGYDALPLDGLDAFDLPVTLSPESQTWVNAAKAVYGFTGTELKGKPLQALIDTEQNIMKQKGEKFPEWALDQAGIEVMFANRISMGPGLNSPRFRWVSYVDALMFPLSTKAEAAVTPDRGKLYPMEDALLKKYLADLSITKLPATLDDYLKQMVTATLESQKQAGCVAVKFEAAYLRSLDFDRSDPQRAREVYAKNINGGEPSHENYKLLQDFIFYYIAKEAGRLGMAVHIHSFPGAGSSFVAAGSDPLLLEPVFNDPELRNTNFVLIHGGGTFYKNTTAMLFKSNVYADLSLLTQIWTPSQLAIVLKEWLSQFPGKILFGTDAFTFLPGIGWELSAWSASNNGRQALTIALSDMIRTNEITLSRAKEIAYMVMRGNASNLYHLGLK